MNGIVLLMRIAEAIRRNNQELERLRVAIEQRGLESLVSTPQAPSLTDAHEEPASEEFCEDEPMGVE